jgi:hypothetical protein
VLVNKSGHPATLIASQPGNANAIKHGVHSPRVIKFRALEIEAELTEPFELPPVYRLAAREVAHNMALLEAIDGYLSDQGLTDRRGKPRYLVEQRARTSRQLGYWLEKLSPELERQQAAAERQVEVESRPPEDGIKRICQLAVAALESDMFRSYPEIAQALELQLIARGWTPPRHTLSLDALNVSSPDLDPGLDAQKGDSSDRDDGDDRAPATTGAAQAEVMTLIAADPQTPPGTVVARVPPEYRSQPRRRPRR